MKVKQQLPRIKNHLKTVLLIYHFIDGWVIERDKKKKKNSLLLIRLDSIGDYLLFRNFLKYIRESKAYHNHHITLCGNQEWRELAETFDTPYVDDFFWVDINRFYKNVFYRLKILKEINRRSFESAIQPTYSREYFLEGVIRLSEGIHRVGNSGDLTQMTALQKKIADRYYTRLLYAKDTVIFEFERNKEFFEQLLETKLDIQKPSLEVNDLVLEFQLPESYAVIFPGARMRFKRWAEGNYAQILDFLWEKYKLDVVLLGGQFDSVSARKVILKSKKGKSVDLTGKTRLSQVAKIISKARLLISNDSCAIHFGASVNTKTVAILPGNFLGRFSPYPETVFNRFYSIYPKSIMNHVEHLDALKERYRYGTDLNVNDVKAEEVTSMIEKVL